MTRIRPNLMRMTLAGLALALAVLSFAQHRALGRERRAEIEWLESSGVPVPPGLRGEPDRLRVRLRAARAALAYEMDPARAATLATLPEAEAARVRQAGAERMAGAARRAASVLADRPAAWDANMILGAATYLAWLQARDTHLFTAAARWEEPLAAALRLAPSRREPARFLASAYLDVWPALSPAKRKTARALLAETFRDPADLGMLFDRWFALAGGNRDELFAPIPHDPEAWNQVLNALSRRRAASIAGARWGPGWSAAWARWDAALLDQLRRETAMAEGQLAAGDLRGARQRFLSILVRVRPDARYRDVLATALERCPPGPVDSATGKRLIPLLSWALDRCLYGDCALEPTALQRLARLVRDADAPAEALTAVVTDDLPRAQTLERRAGILWSEEWAPFLVAKSRALAERGRVDEARETLTQVPRSWERHPLYWQARLDLARAQDDGGTVPAGAGIPAPADLAAGRLAALQREAWPGTDWEWRRDTARLLMLTDRAADHLTVELDEAPPAGAVVELRLDGRSLGAFSVPPALAGGAGGPRALRLDGRPLGLGPGLHLLEVQGLEGGRVVPGDVRLL